MIKSPLRYPGGKSRAINFIGKFIPNFFKTYREPFFGGGSLGFHVYQNYACDEFILNDLNLDLYSFWLVLKDNPILLSDEILEIKTTYSNGKSLYNEILKRRSSKLSKLQRAVDFFVLNRITFSGVVDSGGYSEQAFQNRFTLSSIDRLRKAHFVIKDFNIFNLDFEDIISGEGSDVFMYLDPPYYGAAKSKLYGKSGNLHTNFDHERLHDSLLKTKHKFLLSYDNNEYIRDLYKSFNVVEWDLQYGMNNYKQKKAEIGKELLIYNY
jgi:DNA adenine methylase